MEIEHQTIDEIEKLIPQDMEAAQKLLRIYLFHEAQSNERGTFGEALARLAENNTQYPLVAAVILRFLAVQGLIPESNPTNQIARSVVAIVTGSLPELARFIGVNDDLQTYENFMILRGAHQRICGLLSPLLAAPTTVELFMSNRPAIMQALQHSAVRAYCAPFTIDRVKISIEQVFGVIRKINSSDQTVLHEQIKIFHSLAGDLSDLYSVKCNFLVQDHFLRLLESARVAVDSTIAEARARFAAPIVTRLSGDHSIPKKYPMDADREFLVVIPLRNVGPGAALNVQVELVS